MKGVKLAYVTTLFVLVVSLSVRAQTAEKKDAPIAEKKDAQTAEKKNTKPPCPNPSTSYPAMTYDEDNRNLKNPECRTDFFDRLKYIPLRRGHDDYYLSFGAWVRERGEYFSNPNWTNHPQGSAYLLQRYLVHADLHLGDRFRFFSELGSSFEHGRKGGPRASIDEDKLDIHQAFFDIGVWKSGKKSVTLRLGRQEMSLGNQSLVSARDARNVRRSFDGIRATGKFGEWTADAFALRQSKNNPGTFDDSFDHTTSFWGLYAVRPFRVLPGGHLDLYYMGLDNKKVTYVSGTGREQRETVGGRVWGKGEHLDYNQEFTFQWGRFKSDNIRAWAILSEAGYSLQSMLFKPRIGIKGGAYSGDDASSRTLGTFNGLFETSSYFSYAGLFGRRNLIPLQPSVQLNLPWKITLTPNAGFFWRERTDDGLYSTTGSIVVPGLRSSARYIGSTVGAQLKWSLDRHTTVFAEYLHSFPGDFLRQSTAGRSINYVTWWAEYRF